MAKRKSLIQETQDLYRRLVGNRQVAGNVVSPLPQSTYQQQAQTSFVNKALVALGNSPIGRGLVNLQRGIETRTLPRVNLQQYAQRVQAPVPRFGAQLGLGVAENLVNLPQRLLEGGGRAGMIARDARAGNRITPSRFIGTAAGIADPLLDIATLGGGTVAKNIAKQAGKQVAKQTLKQAIIKGGVKGVGAGALYGSLYGLSEGEQADTMRFIQGLGLGGALGGVLGGTTGGIGGLLGLIKRTPSVEKQLRDRMGRWTKGQTLIKPKGMPQAQWDFQLTFNRKYSRNPYAPVYQRDLTKAIGIEAEQRVGFQARPIGGLKAIQEAEAAKVAKQTGQSSSTQIKPPQLGENISPLQAQTGQLTSGVGQPLSGQQSPELPPKIPTVPPGQTRGPSGEIVPQKYAGSINLNKLNIDPAAKKVVTQTVESIKPELQAVKGKTLTNDEVLKAAQWSTPLRSVVDRNQTQDMLGRLTKLRQSVAAGASGQGLTQDFVENLRVLNSWVADTGRRLQSFNIGADPNLPTIKEEIVKELIKIGKSTDDILKAAQGVNFNNLKEVTKFYRQFVKASAGEWLDEYRYIGLLSSPQTHIVNAFSNLLQATVTAPGTKLFTGAVDLVASTLTGKQRQHYIRQVPAYAKGAINSIGEGLRQFSEAMKGNILIQRPDVAQIPTGNKLLRPFQAIPRLLEASDVLFRSIIKGGEMEALAYKAQRTGKTVSKEVLEAEAAKKAQYFVFRAPLGEKGQGTLLSSIDKLTSSVYSLRGVPGVKWFIPFVQTPMNILKQGIEYSPLGISTLPGTANKTEQLGKALMGSTVFMGTGYAMMNTDSTWSSPTGEKEKTAFYATGRKPYSIKIGDEWVSYSRLGPLAYPMAMAAAIKYYTQQDPKALNTTTIEKLSKVIGGVAKFFTDQSYVQGLGDLVKTIQGDQTALRQLISDVPSQLVPLTSLQAWVARVIDPIFRDPKTPVEQIINRIPLLSQTLEPEYGPTGEPSPRENRFVNALSPLSITPAHQEFESRYIESQGATRLFEHIKGLPPQEKYQTLIRLKANNPQLFGRLKTEIKHQALQISPQERKLSTMGVIDGERSRSIYKEWSNMQNPEEKKDYLLRLIRGNIATKEVLKQVIQLQLKNQGGVQ